MTEQPGGYEWPPLPVLDPEQAAAILAERLQAAWDDLEAERVRVLEGDYLRKPLVDAWLREFQAAIDVFRSDVDANVERFLQLHLAPRYAEAVAAIQGNAVPAWTQPHQLALTSLATDTYDDFLQRALEAQRSSESMVRAVREAARSELAKGAAGGRTAVQAGRRMMERLRDEYQLTHVVYRDGSLVPVRQYASMAARTKSAVAHNAGTLNACVEAGVMFVEVFDGVECGWKGHLDADKANGTIRSVLDAARYPIAHPNCTRAFGPRPDVTSEEQAEVADLSTTQEQRDTQASFDYSVKGRPARVRPEPGEAAQRRRESTAQRRQERAGGWSEPVPLSELIADLAAAAADVAGALPADEVTGTVPPFTAAQLAMPFLAQLHTFEGDDMGGGHSPFLPPERLELGKTLFPVDWFGEDGEYEPVVERILLALRDGEVVTREQPVGWLLTVLHQGVVIRVAVKERDGVPVIDAAWPLSGAGVTRVVSTSPQLVLKHIGPAKWPAE